MTASQARSVLSVLPENQLQWHEHDSQRDIEDLYCLAEKLMEFSPLVGVEGLDKQLWCGRSLLEPQSILMDITGLDSWYGGETALAMSLQRWLVRQGYFACVGIGSSVGQAWAIANYSKRKQVPDWMLQVEQAACTLAGMLELDPRFESIDQTQPPGEFFGSYPIESLRLSIDVAAKLHRLGIRRIGALLQLPRSSLTSRFGPQLLERIDQTIAARPEPISVRHAGEPMESIVDLEHPIFEMRHLEEILEQSIHQLCRRLESIEHGVWRLLVRLAIETTTLQYEHSDTPTARAHLIQLGMFQASRDPEHLLWLIRGCLERNPPKLSKQLGIRQVNVQAAWTAPMRWQQHELFECESLKYRHEAAKLIDGLAARLGRDRVVSASLLSNPLPELQTKIRPLTGVRVDGYDQSIERKLRKKPIHDFRNSSGIVPSTDAAWARPSYLLNEPIEIQISAHTSGEPKQLRLAPEHAASTTPRENASTTPRENASTTPRHDAQIALIIAAYGPERIESQWWSGPTLRRNYFRIVLESGQWWWIYEDMNTRRWYLHGMFD